MKSAILASLTSAVAVLDRTGRIIAVNAGWTSLASEVGGSTETTSVGVDYLGVFRRAVSGRVPFAGEALAGIEAVLDGSRPAFVLEYAYRAVAPERWFSMSVAPLRRPEGGAIVAHTEITERRRAEMEAQRSRQELAHVTRVSTMGALAASLAHELNQPLDRDPHERPGGAAVPRRVAAGSGRAAATSSPTSWRTTGGPARSSSVSASCSGRASRSSSPST